MADLTLPLIGLTTLAGYFFSRNGRNAREQHQQRQRVEAFEKPNGNNIYNSNKYEEVNTEILSRSLKNYNDAQDPAKTGVLPPLYNTYSAKGSESIMSPNVNADIINTTSADMAKINDTNRRANLQKSNDDIDTRPMFSSNFRYLGHQRQDPFIESSSIGIDQQTSLLTGLPIDTTHNNMVPFFGSNVRQNIETFTNESILDQHTGNSSTFRHKQEVPTMFKEVQQDIYGTPIFTSNVDTQRYIPSLLRQNEKPFQDEKISAPKAGTFENAIKPSFKSVDELRVASKLKQSYEGKIIAGQIGSVRGVQGEQHKRGPDTFYTKGMDHLFKTTGEFIAPKVDENFQSNFKPTSRADYNLSYMGVASSDNFKERQRLERMQNVQESTQQNVQQSLVQDPKRFNYENDFSRNVLGNKVANDYGRASLSNVNETERSTTGVSTHLLNANQKEGGVRIVPGDTARNTMKQTTLDTDINRNIKTTFDRGAINAYEAGLYKVNAKTTQKETTIMNNYKGTMNKQDGMGYVVTKYDAKTTGKEIITNNSEYSGGVGGDGVIKNAQVYETFMNPEKIRNAVHAENYVGNSDSINKNTKVYTTYDNPEKVRNAIHVNYTGSSGAVNKNVVSRTNYENAEIRDTKEIVVSGERPAGPQSFQIASGTASFGELKSTSNMMLKEQLNERETLNNYVPQTISSKQALGNETKPKYDNIRNNTVFADRLQPQLVIDQHNSNPYSIKKG